MDGVQLISVKRTFYQSGSEMGEAV